MLPFLWKGLKDCCALMYSKFTYPYTFQCSPPLIRSNFSINFPPSFIGPALWGQLPLPACTPHPPSCEFPSSSSALWPKAWGDGQELLIPGGGSSHGGSAARGQMSKLSGSSEIECARLVARSHEGQLGPVHSVTPAGQYCLTYICRTLIRH